MTQRAFLLPLFGVVIFGGSIVFSTFLFNGTGSDVPRGRTQTQDVLAPFPLLFPITLEIEGEKYELAVAPGTSAYQAMVQAKELSGLRFQGKEFPGLGFFVEEINGLRQNPRAGKYWIYYINGQKAKVGISIYELQTHDVISWKYEDEE